MWNIQVWFEMTLRIRNISDHGCDRYAGLRVMLFDPHLLSASIPGGCPPLSRDKTSAPYPSLTMDQIHHAGLPHFMNACHHWRLGRSGTCPPPGRWEPDLL